MTLFLRADSGPLMGVGHVMRCIALAEAAQAQGFDVAVVTESGPGVTGALTRRDLRVLTPGKDEASWLPLVRSTDAIVLDGYHFDRRMIDRVLAIGVTTVMIDDQHMAPPGIAVVVRPDGPGPSVAGAVHLEGPRFALVREEFVARRRLRGELGPLLVTMGGSDATNRTGGTVDVARRWDGDVVVVAGPASSLPAMDPDVSVVVAPPMPSQVFDGCAAAITAAGNTLWELLAMGMPTCAVVVASNQEQAAHAAHAAGAALHVPDAGDVSQLEDAVDRLKSEAVRTTLSRSALALVDGSGARRVIERLGQLMS